MDICHIRRQLINIGVSMLQVSCCRAVGLCWKVPTRVYCQLNAHHPLWLDAYHALAGTDVIRMKPREVS